MRHAVAVLSLFLLACGPAVSGDDIDSGVGSCTAGQTQCAGNVYQTCVNGHFQDSQTCQAPQICVAGTGCGTCTPGGKFCDGNQVRTCNNDGSPGAVLETCSGACTNGSCGGGEGNCASGAELIYVVDEQNHLLSFNPENNANTFTLVGTLSCPAGTPYTGWPPPANPFSMSVDRSARAWVLFTSGEIFWVNTTNAQCTASNWAKGTMGLQLFGMGFVSDEAGGQTEKLYVAGGTAGSGSVDDNKLAYIDPANATPTLAGTVATAEYSPELTGTGNGQLYAYYPGSSSTFVTQLDKATGAQVAGKKWNLPSLGVGAVVSAWAFAHWGGRFYIFVSTTDLFGTTNTNMVWMLDPLSGQATKILPSTSYKVVGAGVSTCAPVVVD